MQKYEVQKRFIDKHTGKLYKTGQTYDADEGRLEELKRKGFIKESKGDTGNALLDQSASKTIEAITSDFSKEELELLHKLESESKNRKTVIEHIESLLNAKE